MNSGVSIGVPSGTWQETTSPLFKGAKGSIFCSLDTKTLLNAPFLPIDLFEPYYIFGKWSRTVITRIRPNRVLFLKRETTFGLERVISKGVIE